MGKRSIIIAGNWKMNKTPEEAKDLAAAVKQQCADAACTVVLCVPFVDLFAAGEGIAGSRLCLGAQNVHWEAAGAYTGEISAPMLCACGATYVIIGHSERRQYFGETDQSVNRRVRAALAAGLSVILCVGESEEERDAGETENVICRQVNAALDGVSAEALCRLVIAYEPIWAIGTGKTATAAQAQEVCAFIRGRLAALYDGDLAAGVTIQYGGSMNAQNAAELLAMPDIDGGLIGGASLKPADFAVIVAAASEQQRRA